MCDVSSSGMLRAAVLEVLADPGGWESGRGAEVAQAVMRQLVRHVGGREVRRLSRLGAGIDLVCQELVAVGVELVVLRAEWLAGLDTDCWAVVSRCAVREVETRLLEDRLHGVCGDSHVHRLWRKLAASGVSFAVEDVSELAASGEAQMRPLEVRPGWRREAVEVGLESLGPVLGGVARFLEDGGLAGSLAREGTAVVARLAASTTPARRHTVARIDARSGDLSGLGVGERAASSWMSLVTGSRRGGLESALVWSLREGVEPGGHHLRWRRHIVAG